MVFALDLFGLVNLFFTDWLLAGALTCADASFIHKYVILASD